MVAIGFGLLCGGIVAIIIGIDACYVVLKQIAALLEKHEEDTHPRRT